MALEACLECGRQVSTEAARCPQCGKLGPTATYLAAAQKGPRIVAAVVVVVLVAVFVALFVILN